MALRRDKGVVLAALALIVVAGCGRDDFENDPRPPLAQEVTVEVTDQEVEVSPAEFGAGQANFVVANNSSKEIVFTLEGPAEESSLPIQPRSNIVMKVLLKEGVYDAAVEGERRIKSARIRIGPERESSQNELLLP